ncbi:MAG: HEAT repeat domain-containing protein [Thermodesulfobacteriota bacterium]
MSQRRKDVLINALNDPDNKIRFYASKALEKLEAKEGIEDLKKSLYTGDKIAKLRTIYALGKIKNKQAIILLVKALKQAVEEEVRASAAQVLGQLRDQRTIDPLLESLDDKSLVVKLAVIEALGAFEDTRITTSLMVLLDHEEQGLVKEAIKVLGIIGDKQAEDALIKLAEDGTTTVKTLAIRALGDLDV